MGTVENSMLQERTSDDQKNYNFINIAGFMLFRTSDGSGNRANQETPGRRPCCPRRTEYACRRRHEGAGGGHGENGQGRFGRHHPYGQYHACAAGKPWSFPRRLTHYPPGRIYATRIGAPLPWSPASSRNSRPAVQEDSRRAFCKRGTEFYVSGWRK